MDFGGRSILSIPHMICGVFSRIWTIFTSGIPLGGGGQVSLTPPQHRDFISIEILHLFCSVHTNLNPDLEEYWEKQEICQGFCTHPPWAEKAR